LIRLIPPFTPPPLVLRHAAATLGLRRRQHLMPPLGHVNIDDAAIDAGLRQGPPDYGAASHA